ncbi:MAG TPA: CAP domain-containing protein [Pseudomonadota bacterium]|nr:CAP domain-containing protein [Pseudomonadota bacterium]
MPKPRLRQDVGASVLGAFVFWGLGLAWASSAAAAPANAAGSTTDIAARIYKVSLRRGQTTLSERREVSEAAAAVLAQVPDGVQPSFAVIQRELLRKQVIEPVHRQVLGSFATADPGTMLDSVEPVLVSALADHKWRWFGIAVAPVDAERSRLLIILVESAIDLVPPPPALQVSDTPVPLSGAVLPPYDKPQVLLTDPMGQVTPLPVTIQGRKFSGQLRCAMPGHYKVEVIGESKPGPHVLANFIWPCARPLESIPQVTGETRATPQVQAQTAPQTIADRESVLLKLLNRDRTEAGLPALVPDERLSHIARMHSDEMAKRHAVFHHSPTTGTPEDRVRRAKIKNAILAENLAQAPTEEEAERSLMDSPGHRRNILDRQLTRVGIGVATQTALHGGLQLYVTQLFIGD